MEKRKKYGYGGSMRKMEHGGSHCPPGMMYQNGGCVSMQYGGRTMRRMEHGGPHNGNGDRNGMRRMTHGGRHNGNGNGNGNVNRNGMRRMTHGGPHNGNGMRSSMTRTTTTPIRTRGFAGRSQNNHRGKRY